MADFVTALTGSLNDLIRINNDRIAGYERAMDYLNNEDFALKSLLSDFIDQSLEFKMQLKGMVRAIGGAVAGGTTIGGNIYHAWMDVKAAFIGGGRKEVLPDCVQGEEAAQNAYSAVLDEYLPETVRNVILQQRKKLNESYGRIKELKQNA